MHHHRAFPYLQSVYFALTTFIDHFSLFFPLSAIWAAIFFAFHLVTLPLFLFTAKWSVALFFLGALHFFLTLGLLIIFHYQLLTAAVSLYKIKPITLEQTLVPDPLLLIRFFIARLLFMLKVLTGLVLFIAPGLYLAAHYYFSGFFLLTGAINTVTDDSLRATNLVQGSEWQMLFVFLVHASCFAFFFLPLGFYIADFFLLPLIALIEVHLYYSLKVSSQTPL